MIFTPSFITKVVTTLAILPVFAAPAKAADLNSFICTTILGGEVCIVHYSTHDYIIANLPDYGLEHIEITCADNRYRVRSRGQWSTAQLKEFGHEYCSYRGSFAHN